MVFFERCRSIKYVQSLLHQGHTDCRFFSFFLHKYAINIIVFQFTSSCPIIQSKNEYTYVCLVIEDVANITTTNRRPACVRGNTPFFLYLFSVTHLCKFKQCKQTSMNEHINETLKSILIH